MKVHGAGAAAPRAREDRWDSDAEERLDVAFSPPADVGAPTRIDPRGGDTARESGVIATASVPELGERGTVAGRAFGKRAPTPGVSPLHVVATAPTWIRSALEQAPGRRSVMPAAMAPRPPTEDLYLAPRTATSASANVTVHHAELGAIGVELVVDGDGVDLQMTVADDAARRAVLRAAGAIRRGAGLHGIRVRAIGVRVGPVAAESEGA